MKDVPLDNVSHTPGPWLQSSTVLICDHDARVIANCTPLSEIPELSIPFNQVDANARLIAAAPELLQALQALSALYGHAWDREDGALIMMGTSVEKFEDAHAKALTVIAKAGGL